MKTTINSEKNFDFSNVKLYFEEGWSAADSGDYEDEENYQDFSELFGQDWQDRSELKIDLFEYFKSMGYSDDELDKDFFQFYESDGVNVTILNVDAEQARRIVSKLNFVNSKFDSQYFVHDLNVARLADEDDEYCSNVEIEFVETRVFKN